MRKNFLYQKLFYCLCVFVALPAIIQAQTVTPWLTKGDKSALIQQQGNISFGPNSGSSSYTITVNAGNTYQTMDGFGWCLTDGSAQVISSLNATQQNNLLQELFNPNTGLSSNVVRISIASSDLSQYTYSYDDTYGDTALNNFSLAGFTMDYTVPILKKILQINPNIKILATPWSAPYWMKTNNGWVGGSLLTSRYSTYADYFVKYFQAMQAQGIYLWGITPQNEPENPYNEPSMTMNSSEQKDFINNHLGPKMNAAGFGYIKIIAFDHNCDNTAYPTDVLNNSGYVDGAAFHLYAGNISAMSTVHNNTGKNVYFTEQYIGGPSNFSGDFGWHMQNVVIGSANNWSKVAIEWNLATNTSYGPHTAGGCGNCEGAITVNNSSSYTRNTSYYIIGQISKFVKNGAQRIGTSVSGANISASSFKNSDGSIVVVAYNNNSSTASTKVVSGSNAFTYSIPGKSAVTFKWTPSGGSAGSFPGYYNIISRLSGKGLDVADNSTASGGSIQQWDITNGGGNNQRWRFEDAGNGNYYIRVKSTGMYLALASTSTADGIKVQQKTYANNDTYKWIVSSVGSGYYKIENVYGGKALDVTDVSTANGALIQVWAYGGGNNQQWSFNQVESSARYANPDMMANPDEITVKSFSIFPNPATQTVNLTVEEAGTYSVISLTGSVISSGNVASGQNQINVSDLSSGYYFVRFENEKGSSKTLKLLKE
ncbi:RICIN domain-containing protein [Flavobacterium rhizosphaerae]|uniref:RICIN domain-containing protein n=1 Tax=Flavobacterium rhizosphaerae TaxID=3163298 RepID=A0ABW8YUI5_9FLAO